MAPDEDEYIVAEILLSLRELIIVRDTEPKRTSNPRPNPPMQQGQPSNAGPQSQTPSQNNSSRQKNSVQRRRRVNPQARNRTQGVARSPQLIDLDDNYPNGVTLSIRNPAFRRALKTFKFGKKSPQAASGSKVITGDSSSASGTGILPLKVLQFSAKSTDQAAVANSSSGAKVGSKKPSDLVFKIPLKKRAKVSDDKPKPNEDKCDEQDGDAPNVDKSDEQDGDVL